MGLRIVAGPAVAFLGIGGGSVLFAAIAARGLLFADAKDRAGRRLPLTPDSVPLYDQVTQQLTEARAKIVERARKVSPADAPAAIEDVFRKAIEERRAINESDANDNGDD